MRLNVAPVSSDDGSAFLRSSCPDRARLHRSRIRGCMDPLFSRLVRTEGRLDILFLDVSHDVDLSRVMVLLPFLHLDDVARC